MNKGLAGGYSDIGSQGGHNPMARDSQALAYVGTKLYTQKLTTK